ncbi:MAG: B3/B4 domain-containing protein [Acidimicrobiales bacterium]
MRVSIGDPVADRFPGAAIAVVSLRDVGGWDRGALDADVAAAMREAAVVVEARPLADDPRVLAWREAYRLFGVNPKRRRPSAEAMLRRLGDGRAPRTGIPLVDCYLAVSVRHRLPIGGYDVQRVVGDLCLRLAEAGEPFQPLGAEGPDPTGAGEVVWSDDARVLTRCWNWRDSAEAAITEATRDAVLFAESPAATVTADDMVACARDLLSMATTHSGCSGRIGLLDVAAGQRHVEL